MVVEPLPVGRALLSVDDDVVADERTCRHRRRCGDIFFIFGVAEKMEVPAIHATYTVFGSAYYHLTYSSIGFTRSSVAGKMLLRV